MSGRRAGSGEQGADDGAVHVGESEVTSLEPEREAFVVESEEVEERGLEIVNVDRVADDIHAEVIGFAEGESGAGAAAGHPDGERVGVMIASPARAIVEVALDERGPAEFAPPDDEGVLEESPAFEIEDECGGGLVGVPTLVVELGGDGVVLVPSGMHELDAADAPFHEAPGHEAIVGIGAGCPDIGTVRAEDGFGFAGEVGQLGNGGLHLECHLVLGDAGGDLGIAPGLEVVLVEGGEVVQHRPAGGAVDAIRVGQVEDGIAAAAELHALMSGREEAGSPIEVIEDLAAGGVAGDGGEDGVGGEVVGDGAEAVAEPGAECGAARDLGTGKEQRDGRGVVDGIGVHAFHEAEAVGDLGDVGEEVGDPGTGSAALVEGFDRGEEPLAVCLAGHGAETLAADVFLRDGLAVVALEAGLEVEEIDVGWGAVLEEVDDVLGAGLELGQGGMEGTGRGGGCGDGTGIPGKEAGERGHAEPGG